jgi:cold shock CspA family protein
MKEKIYGFIEYFHRERGFGFVCEPNAEDRKDAYFLHVTSIVSGVPQVGASCIFEPGRTSKGRVAMNVQIIDGEVLS